MATIGSTSTSAATSAESEIRRIEREVKRIQDQLNQKSRVANVQEFRKDTRDIQVDNNATARDIGVLKKDTSRLNLFSLLSKADSVDVFRFKVSTTEKTRFSILQASTKDEGKVRFQIFSRATGRIVADSDPKAGEAFENFELLQDGEFELKAGDYALRISRMDTTGKERDTEFSYAVQLTQGLYTKDYDTVEKAAQAGADPFGISLGGGIDNLTGSLAQSVSFMNSLPKIGTSATDKLNALLISQLF